MSAARDMGEVLAELLARVQASDARNAQLEARLAQLEARTATPATRGKDPTAAARQARRYAKRQAIAAAAGIPVRAVSTVSTREHGPIEGPRANAVDLDLGSKSMKHVRPLAESDARRHRAKVYREFGQAVRQICGVGYPAWAPFGDQKACKALLGEGRSPTSILRAAIPFLRDWRPTRAHAFPTIALLRLAVYQREHRAREVPQPRIWPTSAPARTPREDARRRLEALHAGLAARGLAP